MANSIDTDHTQKNAASDPALHCIRYRKDRYGKKLTRSTLGKKSADDILTYFQIFLITKVFIFHANCLLRGQLA